MTARKDPAAVTGDRVNIDAAASGFDALTIPRDDDATAVARLQAGPS